VTGRRTRAIRPQSAWFAMRPQSQACRVVCYATTVAGLPPQPYRPGHRKHIKGRAALRSWGRR